MPAGDFYEFLGRLGHKILSAGGATWYDVQPRVLLAVPHFRTVSLSEETIGWLLAEHRLRALRFPTDPAQFGFESTLTINCNRDYGLKALHRKARNQTLRALERCTIERTEFAFLAREGLRLNRDTATRQHVGNQFVDESYWTRYCYAASQCQGLASWCAFLEGRLAAFLIAVEIDGWVEWIVNHALSETRQAYPNNALAYVAGQHYLQDPGCAGICYGLGSLEPTPDLDHFKTRMGWNLVPIRQRLALSGSYHLASQITPMWGLRLLGRLTRRTYRARKAVAIFTRYKAQSAGVMMPQESRADFVERQPGGGQRKDEI